MVGPGQRVPGDCLVLDASDFKVDENVDEKFRLQKDDSGFHVKSDVKLDAYPKAPYRNERSTADPFVRADAMVTGGQATLLVCCTGERSTRGANSKKLEDDSVNTQLQQVLKNLTSQFTLYALITCFIIFILLMTMSIVSSTMEPDGKNDAKDNVGMGALLVAKLPHNINLFVVLVVVAIPEGLPLTIQISLAFSVMRMYRNDRILLRKQDALEKMA
jgi:Ca2+-transporting ATPase